MPDSNESGFSFSPGRAHGAVTGCSRIALIAQSSWLSPKGLVGLQQFLGSRGDSRQGWDFTKISEI